MLGLDTTIILESEYLSSSCSMLTWPLSAICSSMNGTKKVELISKLTRKNKINIKVSVLFCSDTLWIRWHVFLFSTSYRRCFQRFLNCTNKFLTRYWLVWTIMLHCLSEFGRYATTLNAHSASTSTTYFYIGILFNIFHMLISIIWNFLYRRELHLEY